MSQNQRCGLCYKTHNYLIKLSSQDDADAQLTLKKLSRLRQNPLMVTLTLTLE